MSDYKTKQEVDAEIERGSGKSIIVRVRMRESGVDSMRVRSEELGLTNSEYIRMLIKNDIGVNP